MGKTTVQDSPNFQKYGVPLYGAAWLPYNAIRSNLLPAKNSGADDAENVTGDGSSPNTDDSAASTPPIQNYVVLAGGGGEGRSGIPNAVLIAEFDFASNSLSSTPVVKLGTGADLPYRMAVHPNGDGLICSLPKSCRWFEWEVSESHENKKLGLKVSDNKFMQLEEVGQQLALAFSNEGSLFAAGGEDGNLRVFKWPEMEPIINEEQAHSAVKDLDFSVDGKFLVSVGSGGPCRVWDVTSSKVVASLAKENGEVFGFCRFSQRSDGNQVLYTTTMHDKGGSIVTWNTSSWQKIGSKRIVHDPVSAFSVSNDGKLLGIGTIQGDMVIINSSTMQVQMTIKKAHLGLVTALMFSYDSRAVISASMDSSVRVTVIDNKSKSGFSYWVVMMVVLIAIIAYFFGKTQTRYTIP